MTVDEFLLRLEGTPRRNGDGWTAHCPAHDDKQRSLSVSEGDDGRVLVHCFAGCGFGEIVSALGLRASDLFPDAEGRGRGASTAADTRATVQHQGGERGCTLADYAAAKGLPVSFLESLGVAEITFLKAPAVRFPYSNADGEEVCVRFRVSLTGDIRVRTKAGQKHCLYGLGRLRDGAEAGYVILAEGESDTQTLWYHDYPALGLPGANGWNEDRYAQHLEGIATVYVLIEPDKGGESVLRWLSVSRIHDRVRLVTLDGAKDVSELYLADRDQFRDRFEAALQAATPWPEHEQVAAELRGRAAWKECSALAHEARILERLAGDLTRAGLAGEDRLGKLLYLALTSRFLDRPVSVAIKGPSAGGKSYSLQRVLDFFPAEAFYALTAMSERALAYGTEPLAHRFLILYEAAGLEGDFASYLVRSLLSEGRVRYETVEKTSEGLQPHLIEREGPTGLLITTTAIALHPENETRLLSLTVTDSPEQTRDVLLALVQDEASPVDLAPWQALQRWLEGAEHRVAIPYAQDLAAQVPPVAVRLRRDFGQVLNLIRAHALLHQMSRPRDGSGRVVATIDDYAAVRELVADLIAEGIEATVAVTVRETVEAVEGLTKPEGVSLATLAAVLELDKSAASRRWHAARQRGYLRNLEDKRGKPARIVLGDPLPDDVEILPRPDAVADRCSLAREQEGIDPLPPRDALARVPFGDDDFLDFIAAAHRAGHITTGEALEQERVHQLVLRPVDGSNTPDPLNIPTHTFAPGQPGPTRAREGAKT